MVSFKRLSPAMHPWTWFPGKCPWTVFPEAAFPEVALPEAWMP
jgi:hypothetical protein